MTRAKSPSPWLRRHLRDPYVKQAARQGYRSRAAFKLLELDHRERLMRPGMQILDLGAAPGGWAQVAAERVGSSGRVVGVDLLEVAAMPNSLFIRGDMRDAGVQEMLDDIFAMRKADLVLSDMAPNLTGMKPIDEARSQELVALALEACGRWLKPGGGLLVKLFHGSGLDAVIREMKAAFAEVDIRKPPASRSKSSEVYAVCRGSLQHR